MNRLKLVLPTPDYENKIMNYKREFVENGGRMYGAAGLKKAESFSKWYNTVCNNMKEETVRKGLSPETTYLVVCTENDHLVGMINIRHRLNDFLLNNGGHIDFSVRKSERQKGYAVEMLGLALKECTKLNIRKVLITCDKDNIASSRTIINNGAKLENEIQEKNRIIQRYWINLK